MPARKRTSTNANLSRLKVLAAGDEATFRDVVLELLTSGDRLGREAALDALLERPIANMRNHLRNLYLDVDRDGDKLDPGAHLRVRIAQLLLADQEARDVGDIGLRAAETREFSMGVDATGNLRALGLKLIARTDPDTFPYVAIEHINDSSDFSTEPANTALQLLAGTGHDLSVYQWIISGTHEPALVEAALELLSDAPASIMSRCLAQLARDAIATKDEPLLTKLAETIIDRELDDAYSTLSSILRAGVSNELYGYLALLLARTNRPPLLAILEEQLEYDILRRPAILEALRVRTTPEQEAILKRWEEDHG